MVDAFSVIKMGEFPIDGSPFEHNSKFTNSTLDKIRTHESWYDEIGDATVGSPEEEDINRGKDIGRWSALVSLGGTTVQPLEISPFKLGTTILHVYGAPLQAAEDTHGGLIVVIFLKDTESGGVLEEYEQCARSSESTSLVLLVTTEQLTGSQTNLVPSHSRYPRPG